MWGMGVTFHTFLQKKIVQTINTIVSKCPTIIIVLNMTVGSVHILKVDYSKNVTLMR
jgi:hypothetical protein